MLRAQACIMWTKRLTVLHRSFTSDTRRLFLLIASFSGEQFNFAVSCCLPNTSR